MPCLRHAHCLGRLVLLWFALSLGAAIAAPIVHPQDQELVCSSLGAIKVVVQGEDGAQDLGANHLDCPLCLLTGAAPPPPVVALPHPLPLAHAVRPVPAARLAAVAAAPPFARGPPVP